MSSGTRYDPGSVRALLSGLAAKLTVGSEQLPSMADTMRKIGRLGMSPRQQALNHLWAWYRCENYAARKIDWNGREATDPIEHEAIAHAGSIPPGFYDAGDNFPIKFRKPTAPYPLVKVIVDRFTGLLFSERHHPRIEVDGDEQTEDFLQALAAEGRLWPLMIQARTYGGAMGSVGIGFQFVDGQIEFEVHDPRWCKPLFLDRAKLQVGQVEKRYMYPVDEVDEATGGYVTMWYWYRRIITAADDVVFKPVPVGDGQEPEWEVARHIEHNLGFCPVVWVQNLPVQDDDDGDPDCLGIYELVETIDALLAQANKGVVSNCDPTLLLTTDAEIADVKKGSDNAIKLPAGGSGNYLEISGSGPTAARELAKDFRGMALEAAQCVLEHPDVTNRTATEIERVYSSMITKTDVMREQYGEKGIKPLLDMALHAARKFGEPKINEETGETYREEVRLPPRVEVDEAGDKIQVKREPGAGGVIELRWPAYFGSSLSDVEAAARSAIAAKTGKLIDKVHAVRFVAEYFKVEDVPAMMANIEREQAEEEGALVEQALGMLRTPGVPGGE